MKKAIGAVLIGLAAAGFAAELKDGIYAGKAGGYNGPVRVAVTVKDGRIDEVEVTSNRETRGRRAATEIPRRIVQANSTDVDAISGATIFSDAIKAAVKDALKEAQ
jgi:uncharacterized protein with FMN-binding domain